MGWGQRKQQRLEGCNSVICSNNSPFQCVCYSVPPLPFPQKKAEERLWKRSAQKKWKPRFKQSESLTQAGCHFYHCLFSFPLNPFWHSRLVIFVRKCAKLLSSPMHPLQASPSACGIWLRGLTPLVCCSSLRWHHTKLSAEEESVSANPLIQELQCGGSPVLPCSLHQGSTSAPVWTCPAGEGDSPALWCFLSWP